MYKVMISFNPDFQETYCFMIAKDGGRNMEELSCSVAQRWGHTSYALEGGKQSFLNMFGKEIGNYSFSDIEYAYVEGKLVNCYVYVTFEKLPESLEYYYDYDSYEKSLHESAWDEDYIDKQALQMFEETELAKEAAEAAWEEEVLQEFIESEIEKEAAEDEDYQQAADDMSLDDFMDAMEVPEEDREFIKSLSKGKD